MFNDIGSVYLSSMNNSQVSLGRYLWKPCGAVAAATMECVDGV